MGDKIPLEHVDTYRWRIPRRYNPEMRVPGMVYADDELIEQIIGDNSLQQVANVATLPGIVGYSLAMPDIHWGYGFPVGGVAATDAEKGVISPGGIGFDINCGVRLLATDLLRDQVKSQVERLADELFSNLPSGVGTGGMRKLTQSEMREVMLRGAAWAIEEGYGFPEDLEVTEESGCLAGANANAVSQKAIQRGISQLGSLGSGNHFCEVQVVDHIYDIEAANALGIGQKGQVVVTIHCGSRGFGHEVAQDFIKLAESKQKDYGFKLVDRQLACLPLKSVEGQAYLSAMSCGANFAWANRQLLMHGVRQAFSTVFGRKARARDLPMVYDVCHNIAKMEEYEINGQVQHVCVHRKGATRAFPAGHPAIHEKYRSVGQPVLIPGDMGRYSFVLVGAQSSMEQTFGTCCHGAGRRQSRTAAKKSMSSRELLDQLAAKGVTVHVHSKNLLTEEAPQAYKEALTPVKFMFSMSHGSTIHVHEFSLAGFSLRGETERNLTDAASITCGKRTHATLEGRGDVQGRSHHGRLGNSQGLRGPCGGMGSVPVRDHQHHRNAAGHHYGRVSDEPDLKRPGRDARHRRHEPGQHGDPCQGTGQ